MALDNYAALLSDIASFSNKTNLTAVIPSFVRLFEARANRELNVRQMTQTATLSLAYEGYPLPPRFGGVRSFRIEGSPAQPLDYVVPDALDSAFGVGRPRRYTITDQIVLDPVPDATYTARLRYREKLEPLSNENPTNWLLQEHPDAYLHGALAELWAYLRFDEERGPAEQKIAGIIARINEADKTEAYPSTLNSKARAL